MRLVARQPAAASLDDRTVVAGHVLERAVGHSAAELRYAVRAPDGAPATLVTSLRAHQGRRQRHRFRRLATRRARLDHPAAIRVRVVTEYANYPILIADPYPERALSDMLREEAPLSPARVVAMFTPVAEALDLAQADGLVHEALSADSILLGEDGRLMLDMFGLLRQDDDSAWSIMDGGDSSYASPEQVRGAPPEPAANVYSLTALIVHALTGAPPFGDEPEVAVYSHLAELPPRVSERVPELGHEIDAVVEWGMAKDPAERPRSASDLLRATAGALRLRRADAAAPRKRSRRWAIAPAVVVAAAAACGVVGAIVVSPFGDDDSGAVARPAGTAVWKQLAGRRADLREELAAATTPQEQASAAAALGELYADAARTGQPRALAAAAREADAAYALLATAADSNDSAGYEDAGRAVEDAERRLSLAASRR